MGEGGVYIYNIYIYFCFIIYVYESVTFLPQWVETFIYILVWHEALVGEGEEPWASSEAAASGHGSEEPGASSEAAASGHGYTQVGQAKTLLNYTYAAAVQVIIQLYRLSFLVCSSLCFGPCPIQYTSSDSVYVPRVASTGWGCSASRAKFGAR